MISVDTGERIESAENLQPNLAIVIGGGIAIGLVSVVSLPAPVAVASILLGVLMVAGADVGDAGVHGLVAEAEQVELLALDSR